ncbi:hypothetical protein EDD17DRAFT_987850 [Pisolithus thermaeus]|nr:hypothetical protein EV401DRAFT_1294749 [Pisolithus croceorrhizus]KAI6158610.1 hypothetical protein EDD17DRAFT_987850 [Pisolithus thermaeus]
MVDTITEATVAAMRSIYYHNFATLALSFWDFLITFGDEVRYIWPMKKRHAFKWLYIFHRHFLLVVQITSQIAFPLLPAVSSPTSYNCRALLTVMTVLVECANFTLEFILAFRVFALLGRRPWVLRLLGCLILGEIICSMPTSFSGLKSYAGGILFQLSPKIKIQIAFTTVVHSTLISLTVARHIAIGRTRSNGSSIISQFTRDGTATFLMVMGLLGLGIATSAVKDLQPIILIFWALTCHSICGSRLILGTARMQDRVGALREDENVLLTTHIDVFLTEDLD